MRYLRQLDHEVGRGGPLDDLDDGDASRLPHVDRRRRVAAAVTRLADGGRPDLLSVDGLDALGVVVQDHVAADPATQTNLTSLERGRLINHSYVVQHGIFKSTFTW